LTEKNDTNRSNSTKRTQRKWRSLPEFNRNIIFVALAVSLISHYFYGLQLGYVRDNQRLAQNNQKLNQPVKMKIVTTKPAKEIEDKKKILEAPQQETAKPKDASHSGVVNHATEKETRILEKAHRIQTADAGTKGNPNVKSTKKQDNAKANVDKIAATKNLKDVAKTGYKKAERKPRNEYESMLPSSMSDLYGQVNAGYQDYVDEKIEVGDSIDMNTTEYRFIGYFSNLRKAIQLVWVYPSAAARRGMKGVVRVQYLISKDGEVSRIKVLSSSGFKMLDDALIDALNTATFGPLPDGFDKDRLLVTGNFTYYLGSYGSH